MHTTHTSAEKIKILFTTQSRHCFLKMNGKWIYSLAITLKWKVVSNIQFLLFGLLLHLTKTEVIHGATEHKKVSVKSQQTDS